RLGATDLLASLADGSARGTVALEELGHGDPVERVRASADGDVLSGLKPAVLDGHAADWAVVAARNDEGLGSFLLEQPGGELVPSLDVTRKVARLDLAGRRARPVGPPRDHSTTSRRTTADAAADPGHQP